MMVMDHLPNEVRDLREQLRTLDAEFDREMRARGFDSAQAENVALPSHLAALYMERERIRTALEDAEEKTDD
jgi:predicted mannosyl-3-phosphoglycerate phosphatase (HAD superfamily)